jgi:hypothetical protein
VVELYLDGRPLAKSRPDQKFRLDTTRYADGFHQLTAVAYSESPIGASGRRHVHMYFNNHDRSVELLPGDAPRAVFGETWRMNVRSKGCQRIVLMSQGEILDKLNAAEGAFSVKLDKLGIGPIRVEAVGYVDGDVQGVHSQPHEIEVQPPPLDRLPPRVPIGTAQPGILLQRAGGIRQVVTDTKVPNWPEVAGVSANGEFVVRGIVDAPIADLYQFRGTWNGSAKLTWNGHVKYAGDASALQYGIPLHLPAGSHEFACEVRLKGLPRAEMQFGNTGAQQLDARNSPVVP